MKNSILIASLTFVSVTPAMAKVVPPTPCDYTCTASYYVDFGQCVFACVTDPATKDTQGQLIDVSYSYCQDWLDGQIPPSPLPPNCKVKTITLK
jgi:hypothetical protein